MDCRPFWQHHFRLGTPGMVASSKSPTFACVALLRLLHERSGMKLYLVEIGGMREGSLFESHEVHAVVAADEGQLVATCADRFAGTMTAAHLDGWTEMDLDLHKSASRAREASFFVAELGRNSSRPHPCARSTTTAFLRRQTGSRQSKLPGNRLRAGMSTPASIWMRWPSRAVTR